MANYNKNIQLGFKQKTIGPRVPYDPYRGKPKSDQYSMEACKKMRFHYKTGSRSCLKCERKFYSAWVGNRICKICTMNQDD